MHILAEKVGNKLIFDSTQSVSQDTNGGMLQIAIDEVSDFYYRLELYCPCGVTYRSEAVKRNSSGNIVFLLDRTVTRNVGYVYVQLTYWLVNEDESLRSGDMRTTVDAESCFRVTPSVTAAAESAVGESLFDRVSAALQSVADLREKLASDAASGVFNGQNAVVLEEYGNSAESTLSQNFLTVKLTAIEEGLIELRSSVASITAAVNVSNDKRLGELEILCSELAELLRSAEASIGVNSAGVSANARAIAESKNEIAATAASVGAAIAEMRASVNAAQSKTEECVKICSAAESKAAESAQATAAVEERLMTAENDIFATAEKANTNASELERMSGEMSAVAARVTELDASLGNVLENKLGIVQEFGDSPVTAMSQRAVTQALAEKVSASAERLLGESEIVEIDSAFDGVASLVSLKGATVGGGGSMDAPMDFRHTGSDFSITCAKANVLGGCGAFSDTQNGVTVVREQDGRFAFSIKGDPERLARFDIRLDSPVLLFKDTPYVFGAVGEGNLTKAIAVTFNAAGDTELSRLTIGFSESFTPTEDVFLTNIVLEVSPGVINDGVILLTADMGERSDTQNRDASIWDIKLRDINGEPIELYSFDENVCDEVIVREDKYYVIKRVAEVKVSGTERWNALKLPRGNAFACTFSGFTRGERDVKCNIFPSAGKQLTDASIDSCWVQGTTNAIFVVAAQYTAAHTLDEWKEYLSTHDVKILLKYETPIEMELSRESAGALSEMSITKGANVIFANCSPRVSFTIRAFSEKGGERKRVYLKDDANALLIPVNTADNVYFADGHSLQFHMDAIYSALADLRR